MAGAARAPAVDAWQFYHVRRTNSAAIGVWCLVGSGMGTAWCSMAEYRGRRRRRVDSGGGERLPLESVIETRHRETRRRSAPNRPPGRGRVRCPSTGSCVVAHASGHVGNWSSTNMRTDTTGSAVGRAARSRGPMRRYALPIAMLVAVIAAVSGLDALTDDAGAGETREHRVSIDRNDAGGVDEGTIAHAARRASDQGPRR